MADVAEHDAEEKGEEHDGEYARVDLAVSRHPVGVHERLEASTEARRRQVRRRHLLG